MVKLESLAAKQVAEELSVATVWSWGWGVWSVGESDPDKEAAACVWLWAASDSATAQARRPASWTSDRAYIERVVNQHDMSAVDDMVSSSYTGGGYGWARDVQALREFYDRQNRMCRDWRIDIQETAEVGSWISVRAFAGGREAFNEDGSPQQPPFPTRVEWLALFHVVERMIVETRIISLVEHSHSTDGRSGADAEE